MGFIDDKAAIVFGVTKNSGVAQNNALLDSLLVAEFDTGAELSQLVLGDGGHDGKAQFRVLVQGVDIVVLEEYANPAGQQLTGELDGIQSVSGEAGDFLCNHKVKFSGGGILYHAVKILPVPGGSAGNALVDIARDKGPGGIFLDEVLVIANLIAQGIQLLIGFGGDTGIEGDPQRKVINGLGAEKLPYVVYIHGVPLKFVVSCSVIMISYIVKFYNPELTGKSGNPSPDCRPFGFKLPFHGSGPIFDFDPHTVPLILRNQALGVERVVIIGQPQLLNRGLDGLFVWFRMVFIVFCHSKPPVHFLVFPG